MLVCPSYISAPYSNICIRLDGHGEVDPSLKITANPAGSPHIDTLARQADGKILLGGAFTIINGVPRRCIARVNWDGSIDETFNPGMGASSAVSRLVLMEDGRIMIVGSFESYNGVARNRIARLNGDGSIDLTFDPGGGADSAVIDIAALPGGRWAVGGAFRAVGGFPRYGFAILEPDGRLVTRTRFERFAWANSVADFGCRVEPEVPFQIQGSSNLADWQMIYSNMIHRNFFDVALPVTQRDGEFYRLLQRR